MLKLGLWETDSGESIRVDCMKTARRSRVWFARTKRVQEEAWTCQRCKTPLLGVIQKRSVFLCALLGSRAPPPHATGADARHCCYLRRQRQLQTTPAAKRPINRCRSLLPPSQGCARINHCLSLPRVCATSCLH